MRKDGSKIAETQMWEREMKSTTSTRGFLKVVLSSFSLYMSDIYRYKAHAWKVEGENWVNPPSPKNKKKNREGYLSDWFSLFLSFFFNRFFYGWLSVCYQLIVRRGDSLLLFSLLFQGSWGGGKVGLHLFHLRLFTNYEGQARTVRYQ